MCYQVRFITRSVKCMVTMRWVIAWLGNGFGYSMNDARTYTMRREVGVHLWWMMIWWLRSTKECVTTDVSQFLICPCTFLRFQGLYDIVSSLLGRRRPHSMRRVYKNACPARISTSIMAPNMWKNSLKKVESDNNKNLYETILDFLQRNGTYILNKSRRSCFSTLCVNFCVCIFIHC